MVILIALIISVLLQFGAFFITITLIPKTKFNVAWISISIGFLLMAFRRLNDLLALGNTDSIIQLTEINSWIAIVISISMLVASIYIRKIFQRLNRLENLRKNNEAQVLNAIIRTEEKERRYFSKELHDGLGPILSTIKMSLSALNSNTLDSENKEILQRTEKTVDHAIVTTKEISNYLNPQVLERFGLKKALKLLTNNIVASKKLAINLLLDYPEDKMDYNTAVVLYRVFCELINNTVKHAKATETKITIVLAGEILKCIYEDDGIGFNPHTAIQNGSGILNMKSRIKSINGRFALSSTPGKGNFVKIEVPL